MKTEEQLDILVSNQQRAIRQYLSLVTVTFSVGVSLLIVFLFFGQSIAPDPMKTMLTIAGGLVSSITIFPLKELNICKDRLNVYIRLKTDIVDASVLEKEKIESIVWDAVKKIAIG